jgi:hypothetical protein
MTTKITAAVLLLLSLGGCATNAEMQQGKAASYDGECRSYGAKPGSPAYVACRTELDMARTGRSCFGSCH